MTAVMACAPTGLCGEKYQGAKESYSAHSNSSNDSGAHPVVLLFLGLSQEDRQLVLQSCLTSRRIAPDASSCLLSGPKHLRQKRCDLGFIVPLACAESESPAVVRETVGSASAAIAAPPWRMSCPMTREASSNHGSNGSVPLKRRESAGVVAAGSSSPFVAGASPSAP